MFSLTNMIMLGVPLLVTALLWWRFPRKYGEVRPSTQFLMLGAPIFILGLYAVWVQLSSGDSIQAVMGAGLCLGAAAAIAFWLRERLYFRRYGVFRFVWGELRGMIFYRDMDRVELTGDGLFAVMKNGTHWSLTVMMTEPEQGSDIIDILAKAGVPLPDKIALVNRFGIE